MNTNRLKSFAREARNILLAGVRNKLRFWGLTNDGKVEFTPEKIHGGYTFRGEIYEDTDVLSKWAKLNEKAKDYDTVRDLIEEAAYTWFNRIMAIKILEKNNYEPPVLGFAGDFKIPAILQNAKRGVQPLKKKSDRRLLDLYLQEENDEKAFALLLVDYCNRHQLLKKAFGRIDDFTELLIPDNLLKPGGFIELLNENDMIADDDYKEVELIGWLYQFYIADKKDEVFANFKYNLKARPADIPAATQIFTPRWIVKYMVENTLGRIWLGHDPGSGLKGRMKYFIDPADNENQAGNKTGLIDGVEEIRLLDPACGSGHILVVAFGLLMEMYREEGYNSRQAVENILRNNLFGLDIDERAAQLARFAVLIKAAEYDSEILTKGIIPNIFAMPEERPFEAREVQQFLGTGNTEYTFELMAALDEMQQAKNIGSAMILSLSGGAKKLCQERLDFYNARLENTLDMAVERDAEGRIMDMFEQASFYNLKKYLEVLLLLTSRYHAVVANPPYMGRKNMNADLVKYLDKNYKNSKSDLFAVFMDASLELCMKKGFMGMINQHSWMFLSSYEKLRVKIINNYTIDSLLHLGPRTFPEISGEVVQSVTFVIKKEKQNG